MTDILQAIANIINNPIPDLLSHYKSTSNNRINAVGDALEEFIKDAFANTLTETNLGRKAKIYSDTFSWLGNKNHPPDLIIKNGDAVEVKKIDSSKSQIHLNSSYPKSKLFANSPMITKDCRSCEDWSEKDIIYTIGIFRAKKLHLLWMIYGDCYAASSEYYERIKNTISAGVKTIPSIEFSESKELGRVNKVDPLGITYLRIRGMWGIDNPCKVYNYLDINCDPNYDFKLIAICSENKYLSLPHKSRIAIESISNHQLKINQEQIKSPNNPAKMVNARIINYTR